MSVLVPFFAAALGAVTGGWLVGVLRGPRVKVTRVGRTPLLDVEPGRRFLDERGGEWVALQRTVNSSPEGGTVLTTIFAAGGTPADPRVKYRLDEL